MNYKSKKGFTLIELLVVIAIVGILSGIIIVTLSGATTGASDGKKKADIGTIKRAIVIYGVENGNTYPVEATPCAVGTCSNLSSKISDLLPTVNGTYIYTSADGTSFTLSATLSSGNTYTYNSATNTFSDNVATPGSCGTKNGKYATTAPSGAEACVVGTASGMTGTYSWTCTGTNGGASSGTCSTVAATYAVQSFTTPGSTTWTVPANVTSVEYLVVGGGGAGGGYAANSQNGGGGGAGGMLTGTVSLSELSYTIIVGAGGLAPRGNGGNSSIVNIVTAIGGGGGGDTTGTTGYSGGSSGGSSGAYVPVAPTPSDLSQGHTGSRGDSPACYTGGGGGGKSANGGIASHTVGGSGGAGMYSSITGTSIPYAGGGGGGGGYSSTTPGDGGVGGGGTGASTQTGTATSGTANTGGGGGGTFGGTAGNGGSGIVVVKYINNY